MQLAILHYHLNPGGVTRVIENHLRALDAAREPDEVWDVAVVHGGPTEGWPDDLAAQLRTVRLSLHVVPQLAYDRPDAVVSSVNLAGEVRGLLSRIGFRPEESVLHVHNHALGKNVALPGALRELAEEWRLLLQIHDFAEDFRPENYRRLQASALAQGGRDPCMLYPQGEAVHYAALNVRDEAIFQRAGVARERLHLLPNPVPPLGELPARATARRKLEQKFGIDPGMRLLLYPVRGIRRKNLGEAILWAVLAPPGTVLGQTLPPLNPLEAPQYEEWVRFADAAGLPCRFGLGRPGGLAFAESLAAADVLLTTSLAEGFGMVFCEAWLAGKPLVGRNLPEITGDFTAHGLRLPWLRARLDVPLEWVGRETFLNRLTEAYRRALAAFGREAARPDPKALEQRVADGRVDFGDLDEPLQREVIRRVWTDAGARRALLQLNAGLESQLAVTAAEAVATIAANRAILQEHFASAPSGQRLRGVLEAVAANQPGAPLVASLDSEALLAGFLDLHRFRLLRT